MRNLLDHHLVPHLIRQSEKVLGVDPSRIQNLRWGAFHLFPEPCVPFFGRFAETFADGAYHCA